jgi:prepilin-type processing-associated H-X9-DG protein
VIATAVTRESYESAFTEESARTYPSVDALEQKVGYALAKDRYLPAAQVLACPVKLNPPNWQHGRVLYAMYRSYLAPASGPVTLLDIGTAKGYSALCALWALQDAGVDGRVISLDVIEPESTDRRNTVAECDGPKTLREVLNPWPESLAITFLKSDGRKWLSGHPGRVHCAFVDGKHSYEAVSWEGALLAERQQSGDLVIFDDVQIQPVAKAISELRGYSVAYLDVNPKRRYAIARRK